jgi:Heterokaryon incompatibility protein (HET)
MRLLNVHTRQLSTFFEDSLPVYAILSHTWGDDEVFLQDIAQPGPSMNKKLGYAKINGCCQQAIKDKIDWIWVDTCCIDKQSSAELSEAINSMFRWYQKSAICYAFLSDVPPDDAPLPENSMFRASRWFSRGWTLQELLAPVHLEFFDATWSRIGSRLWLAQIISEVTLIVAEIITHDVSYTEASIGERMSWASRRQTSRREDMAYCLLGLLGVNMPLLYGEGSRAFTRLQEEIIRVTFDQTILSWGIDFGIYDWETHIPFASLLGSTLFPKTPDVFQSFDPRIKPCLGGPHYLMTNLGLHLEILVITFIGDEYHALGLLDCKTSDDWTFSPGIVAIPLLWLPSSGGRRRAARCCGNPAFVAPAKLIERAQRIPIYLTDTSSEPYDDRVEICIEWGQLYRTGYDLADYCPQVDVTFGYRSPKIQICCHWAGCSNILLRFVRRDSPYVLVLLSKKQAVESMEEKEGDSGSDMESIDLGKWRAVVSTVEGHFNSWAVTLEPNFLKFDFETLRKSFLWGKTTTIYSKVPPRSDYEPSVILKTGNLLKQSRGVDSSKEPDLGYGSLNSVRNLYSTPPQILGQKAKVVAPKSNQLIDDQLKSYELTILVRSVPGVGKLVA